MLGKCAAFPYHVLSIQSESDMLRLPNRDESITSTVVTAYTGWMRQIRSLQNEPIGRRKTERVQIYFENCQ
jgi:hypothetical protein